MPGGIEDLLAQASGSGGWDEALGGMSESDARSMSLVQALQQIQEGGTRRTATPIGAIANALLPLVTAPIAARQTQQKSLQATLPLMLELLKLKSAQAEEPLKQRKTKAEVENLESEVASRKKTSDLMDRLLGGQGDVSGATSGMKPRITMGPKGPTISFSSDVMSPERVEQAKAIAQAGSGVILERHKQEKLFDQSLPPKMTDKDKFALAAGDTVIDLLNQADEIEKTIPRDMSASQFAGEIGKYQTRSTHPIVSNFAKYLSGGAVSMENDPRIDAYASWLGQVDSALSTFTTQNSTGGYRLIQYLKDHFPGYGDSPSEAVRKAHNLNKDKASIRTRIEAFKEQLRHTAQLATDVGGESVRGWVRTKIRNRKTGQEQDLWIEPETGQTSVEEPGGVTGAE